MPQKLLEAQRLEQRTNYDIEMLREMGYCNGVENYSRHMDGREEGEPPYTLLDFFPDDFMIMIDESHMTMGQVKGMGGFASGISMSDALHQRKAVINPTVGQSIIDNSETEDWQIGDTASS